MPIRVLIATDSLTTRGMLRMHLDCLGCNVMAEVVNASQALELFHAAHPDLVMIDTAVPTSKGIDSLTLLRAVRAEKSGTTIVIITSDVSDPVASQLDREDKGNLLLDPGDRACF